ncbi:unnamed protein product [Orchesella dallaii]|uniref:Uncharacterized protein n=1 Tax=Orchesella dallaii TaxID=48710 RepID=A0ABP1S393_9HEXA
MACSLDHTLSYVQTQRNGTWNDSYVMYTDVLIVTAYRVSTLLAYPSHSFASFHLKVCFHVRTEVYQSQCNDLQLKSCRVLGRHSIINYKIKMETQQAQALQNRLYFVLEQLQSMARELPVKYQQRINHELLSGLANTLLHDTIFEIVKGLKDIQDVTEKHLFQSRLQFLETQRSERHSLKEKKGLTPEYPSELKKVQLKQRMEQKQNDMKIIMQIDQKVK